ncbi:MAG: twin-arginine translocase TatA/TatE family subunit [Deltaproteobacteria bacterium]|nr:twin-arginine translocase TatA/TatE family subunit [Deltaproteobacteria bacterium]
MFGIGMPEMILILAVALIVIGPKKLPDLARSLGKAMGEFKKATSDLKESMQIDTELKEVKTAFNDLGRDDLKETKGYTSGSDETPATDKQEGRDGDAMDKLKAAFDRRDTDASDSEEGTPADGDMPATGSDPDSETRKG